MKNILFYKSIIKNYTELLKKNKVLFLLIILSFLLSNIASLYAINFAYRLAYTDSTSIITVDIEEKFSQGLKDKITSLNHKNYYEVAYSLENGLYASSSLSDYTIFEGRRIENENEILSRSSFDLNKTVEFNGKEYKVVGICGGKFDYYTDIDYVDSNTKVSQIVLNIKATKADAVKAEIFSTFSSYNVSGVYGDNIFKQILSTPIFGIYVFLFILTIVAISISAGYLLQKSTEYFAVYKLCGAKISDIIFPNTIFIMSILAIVCAVGGGIFSGLESVMYFEGEAFFLLPYKLKISDYLLVDLSFFIAVIPIYVAIFYKHANKKVETKAYDEF